MEKEQEREKLAKIIDSKDFIKECKEQGFEVHVESSENKSKKKENI